MDTYVDAIFIGAINLDYIFQGSKKKKMSVSNHIENGAEIFNDINNDDFDTHIQSMYENYDIKCKQLGGSAFLAMKAFKSIDCNFTTAYVGICGKLTKEDIKRGVVISEKDFDTIDCKEWFFNLNDINDDACKNINCNIGKASALLKKDSTRERIIIEPGANNHIMDFILQKVSKGNSFEDFLSRCRWIHITSFADFDSFLNIINYIRKAQKINPFIKVSADLGDDYTSNKRARLIEEKVFEIFDFIFLSEKEKNNLMINSYSSKKQKMNNLKLLFQCNDLKNQQILVVKHKNKYELYNKIDNCIYVKRFWQEVIPSSIIVNDTGAGDFFAGGFIGGMLSDKLLSHQPAPIEIGSIVAKERLKVESINTACRQANLKVDKYLKKLFRDEEKNLQQWVYINWEIAKKSVIVSLIITLLVGILSGIASTYIWKIFFLGVIKCYI